MIAYCRIGERSSHTWLPASAEFDPNPARDRRVKLPRLEGNVVEPPSEATVAAIIANTTATLTDLFGHLLLFVVATDHHQRPLRAAIVARNGGSDRGGGRNSLRRDQGCPGGAHFFEHRKSGRKAAGSGAGADANSLALAAGAG